MKKIITKKSKQNRDSNSKNKEYKTKVEIKKEE